MFRFQHGKLAEHVHVMDIYGFFSQPGAIKTRKEMSTMQQIIEFLKENITGFLATLDNGTPRVRPFQFMMEKDGKLYFCTNNTKDVFKQLKANPTVEFSSLGPNYQWTRVSGNVQFSNDLSLKSEVLQASELVRSIYTTADNPIFEIFYLEHGKAILADFSGQPPKLVDF